MFKRLLKNKKAQQTAEYALLISLVIAAVVAMQTYAQRTLQSRIKGAGDYLVQKTNALGTKKQYEPYYLDQQYDVTKDETTDDIHTGGPDATIKKGQITNTVRAQGGFKAMAFNTAGIGQED
jgi:Flp pilus assembly pilin Flp